MPSSHPLSPPCQWFSRLASALDPRSAPRLAWLLVGAVLAEQHDEWAESRRYLGLDVLSKSRADQNSPTEQEDVPAALTA